MAKNGLAVVGIGGNSLIRDKVHLTVQDQYAVARETCRHIADMIAQGWDVALSHGNGPQVGFILRRSGRVGLVTIPRLWHPATQQRSMLCLPKTAIPSRRVYGSLVAASADASSRCGTSCGRP